MKKLGVILLFAVAAFVFIGCSDEGTGLRWKNTHDPLTASYVAIQWVNQVSSNSYVNWDDVPDSTTVYTDSKEVGFVNGYGWVVESGGDTAVIYYDDSDGDWGNASIVGGTGVRLAKGTDATLVIDGGTTIFQAKK